MKLDFPEAYIRYVDIRHNEDANQLYARIYMSACLTEQIREEMEWGEPAQGSASGKLEGTLAANTITFMPKEKSLQANAVSVSVNEADDFSYVCENDDAGNRRRTELRFIVRTAGIEQIGKLIGYYSPVGVGLAVATVTYHKQDTLDADAGKRVDMSPISGRPLFDTKEQVADAVAKHQAEDSAGCSVCDEQGSPKDGVHHADGTVCILAKRNAAVNGKEEPKPLTTAERKKLRQQEEAKKQSIRESAGVPLKANHDDAAGHVPDDIGNRVRDTAPEV